ncbi:MAG: type VI secretion system tube protein Hcp [Acidobacteriota bacterium]|nr:type VI secretion system tube protein Hcp [Acidobacteriota bacterium]
MAVDYFLKIEGIKGESQADKHKDEIDLLSWSWGESNAGSQAFGGGGGAGKVSMSDFNFTMRVSKASPKLLLACATGEHINQADLTCRKAGKQQHEYLKVKFNEVFISSFQTGGSQGEEIPVDSIAFNFGKIEYEYYEQDEKGNVSLAGKAKYDLKAVKGE